MARVAVETSERAKSTYESVLAQLQKLGINGRPFQSVLGRMRLMRAKLLRAFASFEMVWHTCFRMGGEWLFQPRSSRHVRPLSGPPQPWGSIPHADGHDRPWRPSLSRGARTPRATDRSRAADRPGTVVRNYDRVRG